MVVQRHLGWDFFFNLSQQIYPSVLILPALALCC